MTARYGRRCQTIRIAEESVSAEIRAQAHALFDNPAAVAALRTRLLRSALRDLKRSRCRRRDTGSVTGAVLRARSLPWRGADRNVCARDAAAQGSRRVPRPRARSSVRSRERSDGDRSDVRSRVGSGVEPTIPPNRSMRDGKRDGSGSPYAIACVSFRSARASCSSCVTYWRSICPLPAATLPSRAITGRC